MRPDQGASQCEGGASAIGLAALESSLEGRVPRTQEAWYLVQDQEQQPA